MVHLGPFNVPLIDPLNILYPKAIHQLELEEGRKHPLSGRREEKSAHG
jgi:hypothetical protein